MIATQFWGKYINKVDPKFRMSLASEFRSVLKARSEAHIELKNSENLSEKKNDGNSEAEPLRLVLTQGLGSCHIWGVPLDVWEKKIEAINTLPNTENAQELRRHLIGGAHLCEIDKLGRMLIQPSLRDYAEVEAGEEVVVLGMGETIEIWAKAMHDRTVVKKGREKSIQEFAAEHGI
ncbi:MAG TPA: hypothetical protein PLN69_09440 [bacterium]|nr:hypothetical protein [bacterium]